MTAPAIDSSAAGARLYRRRYRPNLRLLMVPLLLLSFALQTGGLAVLQMWSDSAYSVYEASKNPIAIVMRRLYDGHPPLYYELLHCWGVLAGNSELSARLLSVLFGMVTVALGFVLGSLLGGRWLGLIAALLMALSPELIYYDRLIRMYSALACLALLSMYLFLRMLRNGSRLLVAAYVAVSLAALFTHYYAALLVAAEALLWGWLCLQRKQRWLAWSASQVTFAGFYLPWLAYAGKSQAAATAGIVGYAPPANGLGGFLQQLWVPFNAGLTLDMAAATRLSLIPAALFVLGLLAVRSKFGGWSAEWSIATFLLLAPIAFSLVVFAIFPSAVRPRFMVLVLPLYLVLFAWLLLSFRNIHWLLALSAVAVIIAVDVHSLVDTYRVETELVEPDAIQVTQLLNQWAQPGDAVVFHAFWEIGYFQSHYHGPPLTVLDLFDRQHPVAAADLASYRRVWLSLHGLAHTPGSLPQWLDAHWGKAGVWQFEPSELTLYVRPEEAGSAVAVRADLGPEGRPPILRLESARFTSAARPGETLSIETRWRALIPVEQQLTVFFHLTDEKGRQVAGYDSPPPAGPPAALWPQSQDVHREFGLTIPWNLPPGVYKLDMGVYPMVMSAADKVLPFQTTGTSGQRTNIALGEVQVESLDHANPRHSLQTTLGGQLELLGYQTDLDQYQVASKQVRHAALGEDVELFRQRDSYAPGQTVAVDLFWRKRAPGDEVMLMMQLVGSAGRAEAQRSEPLAWGDVPNSSWPPNSLAITRMALPLPETIAPGQYGLRLTMQDRPGQQQLGVARSQRDIEDLDLGTVRVSASR